MDWSMLTSIVTAVFYLNRTVNVNIFISEQGWTKIRPVDGCCTLPPRDTFLCCCKAKIINRNHQQSQMTDENCWWESQSQQCSLRSNYRLGGRSVNPPSLSLLHQLCFPIVTVTFNYNKWFSEISFINQMFVQTPPESNDRQLQCQVLLWVTVLLDQTRP